MVVPARATLAARWIVRNGWATVPGYVSEPLVETYMALPKGAAGGVEGDAAPGVRCAPDPLAMGVCDPIASAEGIACADGVLRALSFARSGSPLAGTSWL